jgi:hypothetical protein
MQERDTKQVTDTARKVLDSLIRIDMVRAAISSLGAPNSVDKTSLAVRIYNETIKHNKER